MGLFEIIIDILVQNLMLGTGKFVSSLLLLLLKTKFPKEQLENSEQYSDPDRQKKQDSVYIILGLTFWIIFISLVIFLSMLPD